MGNLLSIVRQPMVHHRRRRRLLARMPSLSRFAALVLNVILRTLELEARAEERFNTGDTGDDSKGSIGLLLMAYVHDVNALLHHDDVNWFLKRFVELAQPRGGVLNTMKTRILTCTSNDSVIAQMTSSPDEATRQTGRDLDSAVSNYFRTTGSNGH
eukprot:scaffold56674_cov56-Cyclotella_meneghiniana.AAC.2